MKILGYVLFIPIVLALFVAVVFGGAVLNGWVLSMLWVWFIVPFGVFPLSIAHAVGLSLVIRFLTFHANIKDMIEGQLDDDDTKAKKLAGALGMTFIFPLLVLFMGWVVTKFM